MMKRPSTARVACWFFDLLGVAGLVILLCGVEAAFGLDIAMMALGLLLLCAAILFCRQH